MVTHDGLWFDRQGQPIDVAQMARLCRDHEYRVVAKDWVGAVEVCTVWLGFDHSFREQEPVLFQTDVFGGRMDQYQRRYKTEAEARKGHDTVLGAVRRTAAG